MAREFPSVWDEISVRKQLLKLCPAVPKSTAKAAGTGVSSFRLSCSQLWNAYHGAEFLGVSDHSGC